MKGLALAAALCSGMALSAPVLDFNSTTPSWSVLNDTVMGGVSSSQVRINAGVLEFTGQVRLENNGGFAGVRSSPGRYDLSGFSALKLRVKGDGKRYMFQLGTSARNGMTYRTEFETVAGQWTTVTLPLDSLRPTRFGQRLAGPTLDASNVVFFGFMIGNSRAERFALQVDWIEGQ
ncbi:CIA30 family protein [Deinococcus sp. AJ005]|uniref:CIA30 family protein n=1 Tax=Deinococcus sp. AJ005 TaxID=2652443 RepID=UPI00125CD0EE|nr:CIA30 family protein [Deinococcus sp. AJ005]QFP75071.1 CIA30 family protein [Deinococcus sp. AJ005]